MSEPPGLASVSPFRRASAVRFPKSDHAAETEDRSSELPDDEFSELPTGPLKGQRAPRVNSSRASMSVVESARTARLSVTSDNTAFARRPSTEPSSLSWVMFDINDLVARAREDAAKERELDTEEQVRAEETAPGSLSSAYKTYPSQVEDERWFEEPWQLVSLLEKSDIITTEQAQSIAQHMPLQYRSADWSLVYSTYRDGTSLKTLYRLAGAARGPDVLVIKVGSP